MDRTVYFVLDYYRQGLFHSEILLELQDTEKSSHYTFFVLCRKPVKCFDWVM